MRRWVPLAAVLVAACSRNLEIPAASTLEVSPGFAAVAPRERVALVASGGSPGYTFAFAEGSPLSGADATVDPATGAYQAGSSGSAQDELQVTDSAGRTAVARVAVGSRIAVNPTLAATAPGGVLAFTPSGGKPPYHLDLAPGALGTVDATGRYVAPSAGDRVERLVVSDATRDAGATATAEIRVGMALTVYRGGGGAVAPHEAVSFVAFGGQPPYRWSLGTAASGGTIDPATGAYAAGLTGGTTDVVTVTDANGLSASASVDVGPALALTLFGTVVRPGIATRLTATGGKAPYAFGFTAKGNRSAGAVDAVTGVYTPGGNVGARDLLQVTDATGTVATFARAAVVAPFRFRVTGEVGALQATDLNGDGRLDLVLESPAYGAADRVTTFVWSSGSVPVLDTLFLGGNPAAAVTAGPATVLVATASGNRLFVPDAGGRLTTGYAAPGATSGLVASDGSSFLVWAGGTCSSGWTRVVYVAGATSFPLSCLPGTLPGSSFYGLVMGRFGGDGTLPDLAWIDAPGTGPLWIARAAAGAYVTASLAFPAGYTFSGGVYQLAPARLRSGSFVSTLSAVEDVALLLTGSDARTRLAVATTLNGTPTWAGTPVDPMPASSTSAAGFVDYVGRRAIGAAGTSFFAAWSGVDGALAIGALPSGGTLGFAAPAPLTDSAVTAAVVADVNGDGVADLALASSGSEAVDVLWGDGDGDFARRPHFAVGPFAVGDVDGDGAADLVGLTATPGLRVQYGTEHQFAQGPETPLPRAADQVLAGDFLGAGHLDALYQEQVGGLYLAAGASDGTFAQPVPIVGAGGGVDRRPLQGLQVAHFGGGGGLDVLGFDASAGALVAVVRDGPAAAHRVSAPAGCSQAFQAVDLNGDGVDDLVSACPAGSGKTFFWTSLASGGGATLSFGAWAQVPAYVTGASPGLVGRLGSGAIYVQGVTVWRVDLVGTGLHAIGAAPRLLSSGQLGVLTPGGPTAIVAQMQTGLVVMLPDGAGTYGASQTFQAPGRIAAILTPGRDGQGQPSPADVLMATGEEVIPLVQVGGVLR